ncbi:hypothetical protein [Ascidiaceihabitans sp.]
MALTDVFDLFWGVVLVLRGFRFSAHDPSNNQRLNQQKRQYPHK